jgi:hypothetical protein
MIFAVAAFDTKGGQRTFAAPVTDGRNVQGNDHCKVVAAALHPGDRGRKQFFARTRGAHLCSAQVPRRGFTAQREHLRDSSISFSG